MLIYNTTFQVDDDVHDNFLIWIKESYIPEVQKHGALKAPRICRILSHREEGSAYSLQWEVESSGLLHRWHLEQGVRLNDELVKIFKDKVSILTGQTGVGKSSLINKLEESMNLKTNEISKALGRGKHTTRHSELYDLAGGFVADTPGFSSLSFINMTKEDIRDNFIEFNEYKDECKYRDCMHVNEDECEIKRKVKENIILKSRYENYVKFIEEKER